MTTTSRCIWITTLGMLSVLPLFAQKDLRGATNQTLNTPRTFPAIDSREDWQRRAQSIREQVLVSCGLWPMPEKAALETRIFDKVEREGYSVEKVAIQTHAGFWLGGNLYRPLGKGPGPFPAVLNPHGHWKNGRLEDTSVGSIPGRCITLARQGIIAFSYDMVGYNDTQFGTNQTGTAGHRQFALEPSNLLWNISLMGLQTWNSIRALDFLESLPDVDKSKLGCTGASGGGTQTFMLGAIDDRLAAQAPMVMVSHIMQGGCLCENAPGLRVEISNMEIAAAAAPRPQLLVAATGDWTKTTPTIEGPAIEKIYQLFNAPEKFRHVRLEFDHNYNQSTREQMYGWFSKWLLGKPGFDPIPEPAFKKEPDDALRVFAKETLLTNSISDVRLIRNLIRQYEQQWRDPIPANPPLLETHKKTWLTAWRHTFLTETTDKRLVVENIQMRKMPQYNMTELMLCRTNQAARLPALLYSPRRDTTRTIAILIHPQGKSAYIDTEKNPTGLAKLLLGRGITVLMPDLFQTGQLASPEQGQPRNYYTNFFTTYNRTDAQERVLDLMTACSYARELRKDTPVFVCGAGRAGLWAMMATPVCDAVIADCDALDMTREDVLLAQDLFVPGFLRLGGFQGAAILGATNPLMLHNIGSRFPTTTIRQVYDKNHVPERYREEIDRQNDSAIADWVAEWAAKVVAALPQ